MTQTKRRSLGVNPGTAAFNVIYAKRRPRPVDSWDDRSLLALLLGSNEAADSVLDVVGNLGSFHTLGEGRRILDYPGCGPGTAARCDVLYEVACRIAAGPEGLSPEDEGESSDQHAET